MFNNLQKTQNGPGSVGAFSSEGNEAGNKRFSVSENNKTQIDCIYMHLLFFQFVKIHSINTKCMYKPFFSFRVFENLTLIIFDFLYMSAVHLSVCLSVFLFLSIANNQIKNKFLGRQMGCYRLPIALIRRQSILIYRCCFNVHVCIIWSM